MPVSGTIKIGEIEKETKCHHPEHNPATHIVLEPGHYRHTCPACFKVQEFTIFGIE